MTPEQFERFVDPSSGVALRLQEAEISGGNVRSGRLVDANGTISFPVVDFIPRFVPTDNYAVNFGLQWNTHRRTQLDSHNGSTYSRDRFFAATGWPADLTGQRILEAGSGAGRFTEILVGSGADVYSCDFSGAVEANYANNGDARNLTLFQGSIYELPLPEQSFDRVVCLGVLQHTPDPEKTFDCLAKMVRPGGSLVVDAYSQSWKQLLHWKYLLRPLAKRLPPPLLYSLVAWYTPKLLPLAAILRQVGGRAGARLVPILDQSDKAVSAEIQRDWAILDTFDALSPAFDHPQSGATLRRWFETRGFDAVEVTGDALVVARGTRAPASAGRPGA